MNKLKLNIKYGLIIGAIVIFFCIIAGLYVYDYHKQKYTEWVDIRIQEQLVDLSNIINERFKNNERKLSEVIEISNYLFDKKIKFHELPNSSYNIKAKINKKDIIKTITVKNWFFDNNLLGQTFNFYERLHSFSIKTASIYQKSSDGGYICTSSNINIPYDTCKIGEYMPDSMSIIKSIEQGEIIYNREKIFNTWQRIAYFPIYINNEIKGFLKIGVNEIDYDEIRSNFYNKNFFNAGLIAIINQDGKYVLHKEKEGQIIVNKNITKNILNSTDESGLFELNENGNSTKIAYKYLEDLRSYIVILLDNKVLYKNIAHYKKNLISSLVLISIGLIIFIMLLFRSLSKSIFKLINRLEDVSKGKRAKKVNEKNSFELKKISESINLLIDGFENYIDFANKIKDGDLNTEFKLLSKEDELGNSLLAMRKSLKDANIEEEKRKIDDKQRSWTTQGIAKFSEIMRKDNDNMQILSYNIISNLIKYLNANQGGLFILTQENNNAEEYFNVESDIKKGNYYFKLEACYAFDRRKFVDKRVEWGVGLIGRCGLEKQTIFLTDIPDDYLSIKSGLGDSPPTCLIIVPLLLNDEIFGVIEIASFKEFEKYQIEFIEKIGESIAATISSVQTNIKTTQLLNQYQEQQDRIKQQEERIQQRNNQMENSIKEIEAKKKYIDKIERVTNNTMGIFELDLNGKFIKANLTFQRMINKNESLLVDEQHLSILNCDLTNVENYNLMWKSLNKGNTSVFESFYTIEDEIRTLYETYTPIFNNDVIERIIVLAIDITKIKKQHPKLINKSTLLESNN